jgi:hypothetical protein
LNNTFGYKFIGIFCLFFELVSLPALSQSSFAPLNEDYYHWIDRYEVKAGRIYPQLFTSIKPYRRSDIVSFIDSLSQSESVTSSSDAFNKNYLLNDSWEFSRNSDNDGRKPILKHFYRKKSDLYHVDTKDFDLHINPVLYWGVGKDSDISDDLLYINTRGVEVRGMVDKKVGFYGYLTDNQSLLPAYVRQDVSATGVIPHEGFWKPYKEGLAFDFLQARGYITFEATKHINIQFGHDRFFIGNGYRSLILSDFAPPSLFLKGNVKVWKINYLFMVNQLVADTRDASAITGYSGFPEKYSALHHLSINIGKKLNVGIFESVIFNASDSTGNRFRMDYLNPIIFYRAVEQQNGSTDNVLLGLDFKWNAARKLSLYGQFVLDEFVISHIRAQDGWWANKFGVQLGGKYVDAFGISNLDLQGEINVVRPYTYSHHTVYGNYTSYRQPMAHPLGANFKEIVGILRYQPHPRLNLKGKLSLAQAGRDTTGANWGGDLRKLNSTRVQEFNNKIGQGVATDILYASFTASWQLRHNVFIDASVIMRKTESAVDILNTNTSLTSLALRINIPQRLYEF